MDEDGTVSRGPRYEARKYKREWARSKRGSTVTKSRPLDGQIAKNLDSRYNCWSGMLDRCRNPKCHAYADYGGRGITVCERWRYFDNFCEDMGPRPPGTSIDRIDNDGNYEPGNCRWADKITQTNNRSNTIRVEFNGEDLTLMEWASRLGVSYDALFFRIFRDGFSISRSLSPDFKPEYSSGENHYLSKLTDENVREIRSASAGGENNVSIVKRYGVTRSLIGNILHGRARKNVQ